MKFAIITHASHKLKENIIFSYEPYVREMNLWTPHTTEVQIVAPMAKGEITSIETSYDHKNIQIVPIAAFDVLTLKSTLKTVFLLPKTAYKIYKTMLWADHIHLRCPGNIGLLGCFAQMLFPNKPKTAKYAGNWDPKATQPWSYRLQKWLLSNTFLTKNMKVLVYGEWPNQTKNIVPFFTASYSKNELEETQHHPESGSPAERLVSESQEINHNPQVATSLTPHNDGMEQQVATSPTIIGLSDKLSKRAPRNDGGKIKFLFVGALTKGKQPLLSVAVVQKLKKNGHQVQLNIYGEGPEKGVLEHFIQENDLSNEVIMHGNCDKETVKKACQSAHFLLFISQSEGWPKAVAEAMFWGCLPITGKVSCIPYMLANGERGALVNANADEIVRVVEDYLQHPEIYNLQAMKGMEWSRQFTMEKFEEEIAKLILP
ncbi:MAG TPA: glycosyl transferase [Lutibacter sp.]|nr:glycosyl transferase [Lutibacter sp.]